ncbi:glycosyltransferase family 117 protein [Sphingobacterium paludis]|uniref:Uncharacterized protein DUF2723 n=1 Tax=Sphingobacterium paludis TaxID=1476465 RepID=A0A4V3E1R4_9SPHI|nr:DUF2723 domain-containing protein [Sphingobacterium paludis]TDS13988.1 uncharacterized protein DUF2723 [Sphingobacterium paludis]
MKYEKVNTLVGWMVAAFATAVYIATADRFNSWWDTGEFIASAYKLQIVHQPGAPLFLMIQNIFSNLAFGDVTRIAFFMNVGSAVCSGLTVLFLFWTITALARKTLVKKDGNVVYGQTLQIMIGGIVGAGAYAFTDSFWYSAVESEVYAMSSLCTALVFWLVLKWDRRADEKGADRWLLVIMYIMGLSIGVHLLNLLTIPAIALVVYFRKSEKVTMKGMVVALFLGMGILAFILWGVIQYLIRFAAQFDLFFVNKLGLGFGTGVLFFALLLVSALIYGMHYSVKRQRPLLNVVLLGVCLLLFGYSSFAMIVIRAHADPSLNNNAPDNVYSFLGYLSREQYGTEPLIKGPSFDAKIVDVQYNSTYKKGNSTYEKMSAAPDYTYDKEMLLPRLYSEKHQDYYRAYLGLQANESPSFVDNLRFLFAYQLSDMYGRYFMWNFVGRENDKPQYGNGSNGNWLSGINSIDRGRLAGEASLSADMRVNPARNSYYYLPLLIGILGMLWHMRRDRRQAAIVGFLFFFTGIAIVLYLNQTPMQPRERDYAYAGSFYAFSIWIGFGTLGAADVLRRKLTLPTSSLAAGIVCAAAAPVLLFCENFDDHDRSERDFARQVAHNYLKSCEPNAILFSYADNDTFPLWYAQEVEGIRQDVRIVNVSYLASHWYVNQLKNKVNDAAPVDTSIASEKLAQGVRDYLPFVDQGITEAVDLDMLLTFLLSDNPTNKLPMQDGSLMNFLPAKNIKMAVDRQSVLANKVVPKGWEGRVLDEMDWTYNGNYITRAEIALLGIVKANNWKRPIYFTNYTPEDKMAGLGKYLVDEGLVKKLMPVSRSTQEAKDGLVNVEKLYKNARYNFDWGNYGHQRFVDVDSRNYMSNFVVPQIYERATQLLKAEGEWAKAKEVAIVAASILPQRVYDVEETYHYGDIVDTLYKVKENKLANRIVNRHLNFLQDNLPYQVTLARDQQAAVDIRGIQYSLAALERYRAILEPLGDKALLARATQLEVQYRKSFFED